MNPKTKNIIILVGVAVVLILIYVFFIKKSPTADTSLTSTTGATLPSNTGVTSGVPNTDTSFVSVLLSVKNLHLDTSIFTDPAFLSLEDGSITLVQDGTQGRPNPFAPIGSETVAPSSSATTLPTPTPAVKSASVPTVIPSNSLSTVPPTAQ